MAASPRAFAAPDLRLTRTTEESKQINRIHSGAIIIAGSGMCKGGRIKHHLKHNAWRKDCWAITTGYQARGTLGCSLVDGAKCIKLWGETVQKSIEMVLNGSGVRDKDRVLNLIPTTVINELKKKVLAQTK